LVPLGVCDGIHLNGNEVYVRMRTMFLQRFSFHTAAKEFPGLDFTSLYTADCFAIEVDKKLALLARYVTPITAFFGNEALVSML
jgi:hypothetical protein